MNTEITSYLSKINENYNCRYIGSLANNHIVEMNKRFSEGLHITEGKSYIKVCTEGSVHSFIVKEDTKQFKKGDILKAASWKSPTKNFSRGNIFLPESYENVCWAGA